MKRLRPSYFHISLLGLLFIVSLLPTFCYGQQKSVAELVVNRFLATGQASERDLLLLMSQPKEFLRYQQILKAMAPALEQQALNIRLKVFQKALQRAASEEGGGIVHAIIALGSWADLLDPNAGDMDVIVKGGRNAARKFNQFLREEIENMLAQEGDDVCREVFKGGARFTVETFEIFVSTLEDFGYDSLKTAFHEAMVIASKEGQAAGAAHLEKASDSIIRRNLEAQRFAAVQKEYYPGASGQDFVRDYFNKAGKSRTWRISDKGAIESSWDETMKVDRLKKELIADLGLSVDSMSGVFKFPVIADELLQWGERAKLGAREQAKGLVRAYESKPPGYYGLLTEEEANVLEAARALATAKRGDQASIRSALKSNGFATEQAFSEAGEKMLWNLTKASNNEAISIIVQNQRAAVEAVKAGKEVEAQYRRIKDYLMSNEQLAGYSKLKPEHLLKLSEELPKDMAFRDEMTALLEYMAEGSEKGAASASNMAKRLVKLAYGQKRLSAEATEEAIKAIRAGKGLSTEVEEVIAVLRRDLADLASIRAISPAGDSVADCIRTTSIFSKSGMTLTPELESMIADLSKYSEIELLQLGFKNSEIVLIAELSAARAQGARLSVIGEALKKTAPKNYRAILKGFVLEAKTAAPAALAFQGAFALWGVYNVVTDPSIPEEEQRKRLGEAIYTAFPTAGLVLDGLPMAYIAYTEGGEVDAAALGQGVAFAGLEILGLVNPVAAVGVLAVYATGAVTVGAIQADWDRQFITALYNSLDGNTLKVQDGVRSFDTSGLMVLQDPSTKLPLVIHTPAFTDLYTPKGDVLLDTGEGHRTYTWKVNYAVRDFAKRYIWAHDTRLKEWETAVKRNFPNINLDEVELWKLGELTEQAADVSGNQFKAGARLVRRYLNERDLLVEKTLRHIKGRLVDMKTALDTKSTSKKELEEIEVILSMEKKIVPNAQDEQDAFLSFVWDSLTSSQTRLEQIAAVWRRYLATYKEAVMVYGRVTKIFESVDLTPASGADLFGLTGVEAKDKSRIDTVYEVFQTTYDKAFQEFKGAKGSNPDTHDPFDADAWKRLLNLRMRLMAAEFQKTTQARLAALGKEVADVIEEIRNHYNLAMDLTVTGPTQSEIEKDVRLEALVKARTKGGEENLKQTRIEWYVNGKYANMGNALWFSPIQEGTYKVTAYVVTEMRGKRESIVSRDHILTVVEKKDETTKTDDGKQSDVTKQHIKKEPPTCSYEYTDWGECVRSTKKQTRSVTTISPRGCVEKQKPVLEKGCNPPPTEEELRHQYLNCLCRCSSGWAGHIGVWYDPEGKSEPECKSSGPCFGGAGAWGCTSRHFFVGPNDCGKGCWEGVYGKDTWDPKKADKIRLEENKKYKKPLTVKITPSKNPADFGDIINLTAEAREGSGGYSFTWGGCAQDAKDATAKVTSTRNGRGCTASVTVTDMDGDTASASVAIQCNSVKVKLTKESPKENTVPVGGKAVFYAEVFSGDKPFSGPTLTYLWEPNPDVLFGDQKNPKYETAGGSQMRNTATFRRVGTTSVWVTVLRDMEGRKATIGESQQIPITVVNPELTIKVTPEKPNIGQEVKLEVTTKPAMGDDIIGFWWEIPGYWTGTGDKASFKPKDNKPIKVTVHAKLKDGGDEVGTKDVTITAQSFQVALSEPKYLESPPEVWKCDTQLGQAQKCGMVTLKPTEFAVFRDLFIKSTITPQPESPRYRWSVDPSGSCGLPGSGSEVKINCSSTGTYTVKLEVTNADGAKLGEGTQSVTISVSNEVLTGSKKSKEAAEKLQKAKALVAEGKLDEGIALGGEAAGLDPKNSEARTLSDKWKNERQAIQKNMEEFKKFIDGGKLPEAQKEYDAAAKLHGKYKPVIDAGEVLKKKQEEAKQKRQDITKKLETAQQLIKQGKIDEAIAAAEDAAKSDPATAKPVLAEISLTAKKTGWDALHKGDHQTAIKRLEQAVKLNPSDADGVKKLADAKAYASQIPRAQAKGKEFDDFISQKKIWSAQKAMLELQDILRPLTAGQSSENPLWKHVSDDFNKGIVWYNDFSQKAMTEWTRLFKEQEWEQAEKHLKQVLTVELSPADKKQHESSLQMVNTMLGQRTSAMQYYESTKTGFAKGLPADAPGLTATAKELRNRAVYFKQNDPRKAQIEDLAAQMEKKQKVINAKAYAQSFFNNGDQYYRSYNFDQAIGQYAEGLRAMKENGDSSDPDYTKYSKLYDDAAAKDKRFKELFSYAAALAVTDKILDEETVKKGIAAAEEGLRVRPKNGDMEIHWNKLKWKLGELQRIKGQQQQAAQVCEAKWTDGKALYDSGRHAEALVRFKENVACAPGNRERESYIRQLEESLKGREAAKQACTAIRQQGDALVQQKKLPEAVAKYRESLKCYPDPKLEQYIAQIEATIKQSRDSEAAKQACASIRQQGDALVQQKKFPEAVAKYRESLKCYPDPKLEQYIAQVEATIKQALDAEAVKQACAAIRQQGDALVQQKRYQEAITQYRESLKCYPDPKLEQYIGQIESMAKAQPPVNAPTTPASQFYSVDLTPYGGKKGSPRNVKSIAVDDGSWIRLKATNEKRLVLSISLPTQIAASAIAVISNLDNAHYLKDGFVTTILTVNTTSGDRIFEFKAGVHTSEWNRSETGGADHAFPKDNHIGDKRWMAIFQLPRGSVVTGLRFDHRDTDQKLYHAGAAPGFCLRGITLVGAGISIPATTQSNVQSVTQGSSPTTQSGTGGSFAGTWRAVGTQKEELILTMTQSGSRLTGTYVVTVLLTGGKKDSFNGQFEGSVSGSRATGSFRDAVEKEGMGTFDFTVSSDGRTIAAILKGGDTTEKYNLTRIGGGGAASTLAIPGTSAVTTGNRTVRAEITNKANVNTHIFVQGESFAPANKYAPGEKRNVQVQTTGNGSVTFIAGRDGKIIMSKTWQDDPANPNKVPVVIFDDKLIVSTELR
jgi:tetratricopeptide (TPR) repeat protein